jgi:hypothetical protein
MRKYVEYRLRDLRDALPSWVKEWWYWRTLSRRL